MTPDEFRQIGEALFGSEWPRPLARALGLRRRGKAISEILRGSRRVSPNLERELRRMLAERQAQFRRINGG